MLLHDKKSMMMINELHKDVDDDDEQNCGVTKIVKNRDFWGFLDPPKKGQKTLFLALFGKF